MLASPNIGLSYGGAFSPLNIASGCQLWLRGSLGTSVSAGLVTGVADQSGNGRNVVNSSSVAYAATVAGLNNQPGWTFVLGSGYLTNTTQNLFAAGNARSIYVVCLAPTEVGGVYFEVRRGGGGLVTASYFAGGSASLPFPKGLYTDSVDGTRNASLVSPITIGNTPLIYEVTCAAAPATPVFKLNGTAQAFSQTNPCDAETAATGFNLGFWGAGGNTYTGTIAEVIVYDSVLSAAKASLVRSGLGALYGIPVV